MNKLENLRKKILYRASYRGTKEMDILLTSFVKFYLNKFNEDDLLQLEKLLNFEDDVILDFYLNKVSDGPISKNSASKFLKKFKI